MSLGGYKRNCGKRSGGLSSLALVSAKDVAGAEYDPQTGTYTGITLTSGARFSTYAFKEGTASYTEEASMASGTLRIVHKISFALERPDGDSAAVIEEIVRESDWGLVALVSANSKASWIVGYSELFGTQQPLRFGKSICQTGQKAADDTLETIVLISEDSCKALTYTGPIPTDDM